MGAYLDNGAVLEKESDEISTVGGDANILLASLALAFRGYRVSPFSASLRSRLRSDFNSNKSGEQSVDAPTDFGYRPLEVDSWLLAPSPPTAGATERDLFVRVPDQLVQILRRTHVSTHGPPR